MLGKTSDDGQNHETMILAEIYLNSIHIHAKSKGATTP